MSGWGPPPIVVSQQEGLEAALGILGESVPLTAAGGTTAVASQRVYVGGVYLKRGQVVTNVLTQVTTKAVGAGLPTLVRVGLADRTLTMLAVSADLHAGTVYTTATGIVQAPLTAPYTIPTPGIYYLMYLQNGVWTTNVTFANAGFGNAPSQVGTGPYRGGVVSGQTDLPAVGAQLGGGALGGTTSVPWLACN